MHRFRNLLNRNLFQSPFPLSRHQLQQQWVPLERYLSLSCPALSDDDSKRKSDSNGRPPPAEGNGDTSSTSTAYNTISDILNVTTKARDKGQFEVILKVKNLEFIKHASKISICFLISRISALPMIESLMMHNRLRKLTIRILTRDLFLIMPVDPGGQQGLE